MAKRTVTTLIDDIDGSEATETVAFAYRGTTYTIDLNDKNVAAFEKAIHKYVEHATRDSNRKPAAGRAGGVNPGKRTDLTDIRTWATDQGYEISSRGRIAAEIVQAYDAAQ